MALVLTDYQQQCLQGQQGKALQWAMQLISRVAKVSGAKRLIPVTQAHLVGSYYSGPADLALINKLASQQARVVIPTTLSSSSTDRQQPRLYPSDHPETRYACELIESFQQMGCDIALTCAPYHLPTEPQRGDNIAWAESNAVVYANSVIGARTNKTYQYLDLAAALTGVMPEAGLYLTDNRRGERLYLLDDLPKHWQQDDSFYQLLGLFIGGDAKTQIPVIEGLALTTSNTALRNLGSAAACAGNFGLIHAVGLTPEANTQSEAFQQQPPQQVISVQAEHLLTAQQRLTTAISGKLGAICMGTPHFSQEEFKALAELLAGREIHPGLKLSISTSRHTLQQLPAELLGQFNQPNIYLIADTCTYYGQLFEKTSGVIMTCSAKWAYYAPGNLNKAVIFARMADCVESAIAGEVLIDQSFWQA